jgi:hypothetical protein
MASELLGDQKLWTKEKGKQRDRYLNASYHQLRSFAEEVEELCRARDDKGEFEEYADTIHRNIYAAQKTRALSEDRPGISGQELTRGALTQFVRQADLGLSIISSQDRGVVIDPIIRHELQLHLNQGIELIAEQRYEEAKRHFEDDAILRRCGMRFSLGRGAILSRYDEESVRETLQVLAANSWFRTDRGGNGEITPCYGYINEERPPRTAEEWHNAKEFIREIVTVYAEEWGHGVQHAKGRLLSAKRYLIKHSNSFGDEAEIDIAEYFREKGVLMSPPFLVAL